MTEKQRLFSIGTLPAIDAVSPIKGSKREIQNDFFVLG
jgi:hypothetical protein